jgi:hypothetical protein
VYGFQPIVNECRGVRICAVYCTLTAPDGGTPLPSRSETPQRCTPLAKIHDPASGWGSPARSAPTATQNVSVIASGAR